MKPTHDEPYAESIITDPALYDAIEVHGVRDLNGPQYDAQNTYCEIDDATPEFYSAYAHLKDGGVECIGDFVTCAAAETYAQQIATRYGWTWHNYTDAANTGAMTYNKQAL